MSRGNQREVDRARAQARKTKYAKTAKEGTPESRNADDAIKLAAKVAAKKEAKAAAEAKAKAEAEKKARLEAYKAKAAASAGDDSAAAAADGAAASPADAAVAATTTGKKPKSAKKPKIKLTAADLMLL